MSTTVVETARTEAPGPPAKPAREVVRGEMQMLNPNTIVPSLTNPRKVRNGAADEELLESVRVHGVIEPILVRPTVFKPPHAEALKSRHMSITMKPGHECYELVAGERRWEASIRAGKEAVRAVVQSMPDEEALELQIVENDQREDMDPFDRAAGYVNLRELYKKTMTPQEAMTKLKAKLGRKDRTVYNILSLVNLGQEAQLAFRQGKISISHAYLIASLTPEMQKRLMKACTNWNGDFASVREMQQWILREVYLSLDGASFRKDDPKLVPEAGACTECHKNTAVNPELAVAEHKRAACTDPACYQKKQKANLVQIEKAITQAGDKAVRVSDVYNARPTKNNDFIPKDRWDEVKPKSCKSAKAAVIIDGPRTSQRITMCDNKSCAVHHPATHRYQSSSSPRPSAAERKKEEKRKQERIAKAAIQEKVRYALLEQLASKAKLDRRFLNELAVRITMDFASWNFQGWQKAVGLPDDVKLYATYNKAENTLKRLIPKLKEGQLAAFLMGQCLDNMGELRGAPYETELPSELQLFLKMFKIDPAAVRRHIEKEKAKPAQTSAKR